jgi:hypothetical protein
MTNVAVQKTKNDKPIPTSLRAWEPLRAFRDQPLIIHPFWRKEGEQ